MPSPEALAEAERARGLIKVPPGLRATVWAAEPLLENAVAFHFDERGRAYVAETFRVHKAILDIRSRGSWPSEAYKANLTPEERRALPVELLDGELAARTVADRERMLKKYFVGDLERFTEDSELIKRVVDEDGNGSADHATVFAAEWNGLLDGTLAGVLARKGTVYATNIPSLWRLQDNDDDGRADRRTQLSTGYGLRWGFFGHDMHGLRVGPDGRLYFSIGDRGAHVEHRGAPPLLLPDAGAVFRCELDGSKLEIFHTGLRNPQELAFDEHGNLLTGDNNSDGGDRARIVYVVEGGDSGWRFGYQHLDDRGPWNRDKLWWPAFKDQAAYVVPPIANLTNGPSGLTYHPGTGPLSRYRGHFFLADFRGQASSSSVWSFRVADDGAHLRLVKPEPFVSGVLATDVEFAPDGYLYLLDWVTGWTMTGKGRIFRVGPETPSTPVGPPELQAAAILPRELTRADDAELTALLRHPDLRVRQEAQLAAAATGRVAVLAAVALHEPRAQGRRHGVWGLGQLLRAGGAQAGPALDALVTILGDRDPELRAQAARMLGDAGTRDEIVRKAGEPLLALLGDPAPRVRYFSAIALGNLGFVRAVPGIREMLRANRDRDPLLRHAGSLALYKLADEDALAGLAQAGTRPERLAAAVALRRKSSPRIAELLTDAELAIVREAARAINDLPIPGALSRLAALLPEAGAPATTRPRPTGGQGARATITDEAILVRAAEAALRLGQPEGARRLAALALSDAAPPNARRFALAALSDWRAPRPRNRVTGAYQPFVPAERDATPATAEAERAAQALLGAGSRRVPVPVVVAAAELAARLSLTSQSPGLLSLATARGEPPEVRMAALQSLRELDAPALEAALPRIARDPDAQIRMFAFRERVRRDPRGANALAVEALRAPSIPERQAAIATLAQHPGAAGDAALLRLADALVSGKLAPELELDVIEAMRVRDVPELATRLERFEAARASDDISAYKEALRGGDVRAGQRIFEHHEQVQCRRCHSTEGHGDMVGPGLAGIGRKYDRKYLLEAVVFPSRHFAPGFESVLVTMKGGSIHGGTIKKETPIAIDLESVDEGLISLQKKLIAERERGVSAMPEGFGYILSRRELRDLVEFLASLK